MVYVAGNACAEDLADWSVGRAQVSPEQWTKVVQARLKTNLIIERLVAANTQAVQMAPRLVKAPRQGTTRLQSLLAPLCLSTSASSMLRRRPASAGNRA